MGVTAMAKMPMMFLLALALAACAANASSLPNPDLIFPGDTNGRVTSSERDVVRPRVRPRNRPRLPDHLKPAELPCLSAQDCPALRKILVENREGIDEFDTCGRDENGATLYRCPELKKPTRKTGTCRCFSVSQCPPLLSLARRRKFDELRKYERCGFKNGEIFLCCPQEIKRAIATAVDPMPIDTRINEEGVESFEGEGNGTGSGSGEEEEEERDHEDAMEDVCGFQNSLKIFGGEDAGAHEYPWATALAYINTVSDSRMYLCGGTLISPQYVLTAAHCISSKNGHFLSKVRVGHANLNSGDGESGRDVDIVSIIINPGFRVDPHLVNDLALLKLAEPLQTSSFVRPICLPKPNRTEEIFNPMVIGWGLTEHGNTSTVLQELDMRISTQDSCLSAYRSHIATFQLSESQVCAEGVVSGTDSCKGDSGGPLMYLNLNSQWEIIGVTSFGTIKCDSSVPGVYTRVANHLDWIKTVIESG